MPGFFNDNTVPTSSFFGVDIPMTPFFQGPMRTPMTPKTTQHRPISTEERLFNKLNTKWGDPVIATALLGNIRQEAGPELSWSVTQKGMDKKDSRAGQGLFQFSNVQKEEYQKYLDKLGLEDSEDSQIDFAYDAMTKGKHLDIGAGNRKKLNKALYSGELNTMMGALMDKYFRSGSPELEKRKNYAQGYFDKYVKPYTKD